MSARVKGTARTPPDDPPANAWPAWARWGITCLILWHAFAVIAGMLAATPSSSLELAITRVFDPYLQLIDQGYAYRYYVHPGPTPVVTAKVRFDDGRPEESVRLPVRGTWPRLRYQRQLALANHLTSDFEEARRVTGDGGNSAWAKSFARHVARRHSGCATVSLYTRAHLLPEIERVERHYKGDGAPFDLDAEDLYATPEWIGDYACDGL